MRVVRFDPELSMPVPRAGTGFRLSPLAETDEPAAVSIIYLGPGGSIDRHPAVGDQLFCVVDGSAIVSGGEGAVRELTRGYGAMFAAGEDHDARTDAGMTAVVVEGSSLRLRAVSVMKNIEVVDYDPSWPDWFEQIRAIVWPAVAAVALRIDHVGSTAVPGLAAKPIIDTDIVVASEDDVAAAIESLRTIGYRWRGDLGVPGREAFFAPEGSSLPSHHLYLVVEENRAHLDHVLLRDLLRADSVARDRYGELKRRNVELAAGDMDVYLAAKASLVAELLTRARADRGLPPVEYWDPDP